MARYKDERINYQVNVNLSGIDLLFLSVFGGGKSVDDILVGSVGDESFLVSRESEPAFIVEPLHLTNPLAKSRMSTGGFGAWGNTADEEAGAFGNEWIPKSR